VTRGGITFRIDTPLAGEAAPELAVGCLTSAPAGRLKSRDGFGSALQPVGAAAHIANIRATIHFVTRVLACPVMKFSSLELNSIYAVSVLTVIRATTQHRPTIVSRSSN
jgi:hypothetical protein